MHRTYISSQYLLKREVLSSVLESSYKMVEKMNQGCLRYYQEQEQPRNAKE
jgi:hypothetical protein